MPPKLTLCYCDPAFNHGRPVLACCDTCEARHLERALERRGQVAREHPASDAWGALVESYYRSLDADDRARDRADDYRLGCSA